jgi:hypothetical protein
MFGREFRTQFGSVSNMPPERNLISMFDLNNFVIQIGGTTIGWIAFPIKGNAAITPGTKFDISCRDAFNKTISVTHHFDAPFDTP